MPPRRPRSVLLSLVFACAAWSGHAQTGGELAPSLPQLKASGPAVQLIVDGKPYLALAGELHNSSSTSRAYMQPIWPKLAQLNLNTVLAAVPWDMVQPAEGTYDFSRVDHLIEDARAHKLRLVLLWFGSWKNGLSHYVPPWVKTDHRRFPRAVTRNGTLEILSPLGEASRDADAKAFAALMQHVRSVDARQQTVIMVQVQNEVGLHADSRDRSEAANAAFAQPVPRELMDHLQRHRETLRPALRQRWQAAGFKTAGSWEDVFGAGPATDEAFMAWHFARYVNRVAEAGKAAYALPMFVNAWIVQPSDEFPGEYPTGGPQAHVLDLWHAGAPAIDLFTPDIYLPNFAEVCAEFDQPGKGFFVPESRAGAEGAGNAVIAIGRHAGIGYSPFGIESRETDPASSPIGQLYALLGQLAPQILAAQAKGTIAAVALTKDNPTQKVLLNGYALHAALRTDRRTGQGPERAYGLILATGPDEFMVLGSELHVTFAPAAGGRDMVGLATVEEGVFDAGRWVPGRLLNGDEIMISYDLAPLTAARQSGTGLRFVGAAPKILRVQLYRFP